MEPLAEATDLALRVGASADDPLIELAVRRASDRFRAAVRHPLTFVLDDRMTLDGTGTETLLLPAVPVASIQSVTLDGAAVTDYTLSPRWGILRRRRLWRDDLGNIDIVFTHGYEEVPGDVQDAVLEQAESQFMVLAGIDTATSGSQSISFGKLGTVGVTQRWSEAVARHQLR